MFGEKKDFATNFLPVIILFLISFVGSSSPDRHLEVRLQVSAIADEKSGAILSDLHDLLVRERRLIVSLGSIFYRMPSRCTTKLTQLPSSNII